MQPDVTPPALAAVAAFPHLQAQAEQALARQARRVAERVAHFIPRPALVKALDERIGAASGGVIALEGPPGSGTTSLLCYLAALRPYALWLPEDDAGAGLEALCAQLIALYDLPVPLVPPAAGRDATTLERLLAEAGARRPPDDPLVVLIDRPPPDDAVPALPPFPAMVPPGTVIVQACSPQATLPLQVKARATLPIKGVQLERRLAQVAARLGCPPATAALVAAHSHGLFLYVRLAAGMLERGQLQAGVLPDGLEELQLAWWHQLDAGDRRIAAVLAAAAQPPDVTLLAALAETPVAQAHQWIERHRPFLELVERHPQIYHTAIRAFIARQSGDALAGAHARYVALARERSDGHIERLNYETDGYLVRQLARHIALGDGPTRTAAASVFGQPHVGPGPRALHRHAPRRRS